VKIINRIMISSAFLVLLSLVSLLAVIGAIIFWFPATHGELGKEVLDKDVFHVGKVLEDFDISVRDWDTLNARLSEYGYKLLVLADNHVAFSTLHDSQTGMIEALRPLKPGQNVLVGQTQDWAFAAISDNGYSIFAVNGTANNDNSNFFESVLQPFLAFCLTAIGVILLLSQLFTRKMAWRIFRPLNALSDGANRIQRGDLSKPIVYTGSDEFASVCTAFNHMQEHLAKERMKNAAFEKARTDLIAGISHDLRTPLTSVKGYIKGLRDGVANTPEKREQYLSIAYQKACDMDVLLQKLFFFLRIETGNLPLSLGSNDLADFARRFAEDIRDELAQKNVTMIVDATSIPHPVNIDAEQMRRVLLNLTENAVKYAGVEPLTLTITIWREREMEHLCFADNGQGVPNDQLPHMFERFWRGDEARTAKESDGSGLGLSIVKYIAEAHGGSVEAKNDHGLAIEIALPCGREESQ